ncbi:MAG: potassium channel family protein [Chloroflexi bacterium]|nr:potassium channel family protein [Chloroflexota bacterium]
MAHRPLVEHSNSYNLFVFVLTIFSLLIMVGLLLPLDAQTSGLLRFYDNAICVIFLLDFGLTMRRSPSKSQYFFQQRGWLDLMGSIPALGFFEFTALLRLARLSRLARISRLLQESDRGALVGDVIRNRAQYAAVVTLLLAMIVLTVASIFVLEFESRAPDANITTGGDAAWWAIVTITTVGYGDKFPVTPGGRITGVFVMVSGVGIIGALASIFASILVPPPASTQPTSEPAPGVEQELAAVRVELAAIREALQRLGGASG